MKPKYGDLTGKKFGKLQVLEKDYSHGNHETWWLCQCDCGNIKSVRQSPLVNYRVSSCGCYKRELLIKKHYIHGLTDSRLHIIWMAMRQRCNIETNKLFRYYGGRGIKVCDEWNKDFISFYNWAIKNGYQDNLTIDRIDVNGDYEPSNCCWIPQKEQCRNRRNTIYVTHDGQKKPLSEWAEILEIPYSRLIQRYKNGWNEEELFLEKRKKNNL